MHRSACVALALCCLTSPALAQSASAGALPSPEEVASKDALTIGAGVAFIPEYDGSDDYRVIPAGAIRGKLHGISFSTHGTYLYVDRPAGQHQFFAAEPGFPGETHQDIAVQSGRTYFYLARNSDRKNAVIANASTGLLGYGLTLAMTSAYKNQGPVDFSPVDEAAARTTVAELKLAE